MRKPLRKKVVTKNLFDIVKPKKESSFTMIDLFAGIGGIRLGFEKYGGECVFSSEWDKAAQQTYQANFGELPYGDITQIQPEEIPDFDVLLAGFPCQPFSQAGKKMGLADTRGTLFFDIAKIVEYHRPKVVFLENVKRFKTHDNGRTYQIVVNVLTELGYSVYSKVLNARDFGVPQNRERVYIVAFRDAVDFTFPEPSRKKINVGSILEKKTDPKYTLSDKLWNGHRRRKKEHEAKGYGFGYCLFGKNSSYTSTMSARYYKDGSEILIAQKNKNPRKLTPREAARLQGYSDSYLISVSDTQAYKQFGNSVAVPVIEAIARNIVRVVDFKSVKKHKKTGALNIDQIREESVQSAISSLSPVAN